MKFINKKVNKNNVIFIEIYIEKVNNNYEIYIENNMKIYFCLSVGESWEVGSTNETNVSRPQLRETPHLNQKP